MKIVFVAKDINKFYVSVLKYAFNLRFDLNRVQMVSIDAIYSFQGCELKGAPAKYIAFDRESYVKLLTMRAKQPDIDIFVTKNKTLEELEEWL